MIMISEARAIVNEIDRRFSYDNKNSIPENLLWTYDRAMDIKDIVEELIRNYERKKKYGGIS